ncbi:gluconeogenesis factor YvcK family protein [Enterococcus nangangensis]|uniref:gluconeogenesis factor YvcK family protein n=1 Tax=Enterococcus nangangensis TaxID=2559926 RepID=UPI0010F572FE|nr:YvcK family protein [Enterococcus nangangensis]
MKTYRLKKPKIVVIGGGTGLPVILKGLRNQGADITAIVTVADDGGSSGELRKAMRIAPPGDLRNVLVALSEMPQLYEKLFQYRFQEGDDYFANHSLGNLIIAALAEMKDSMYDAIQILGKILHIDGHVYPASEEPLTLHAVFKDGTQATGESSLVKDRKTIDHVFVTTADSKTTAQPARKVVKAIEEADLICLGPGSLFTSILPNLVIPEIGAALLKARGEVVYICNIMTQKGETEHFSDADHIRVLHHHLQQPFVNTVLVNTQPVPVGFPDPEIYDEYLVQVTHDFQGLRAENCRVISADFLELKNGGVFHDGDKVVEELFRLIY